MTTFKESFYLKKRCGTCLALDYVIPTNTNQEPYHTCDQLATLKNRYNFKCDPKDVACGLYIPDRYHLIHIDEIPSHVLEDLLKLHENPQTEFNQEHFDIITRELEKRNALGGKNGYYRCTVSTCCKW